MRTFSLRLTLVSFSLNMKSLERGQRSTSGKILNISEGGGNFFGWLVCNDWPGRDTQMEHEVKS